MLNNPGDETRTSPADETSGQEDASHSKQIGVIVLVGLYLFGVVWLYANLPWLGIGVTGIAVVMIILGFVHQLRHKEPPPSS